MYKKLKVIKNLCLIKCCGQIEDQNAVCRTNVRSTWPSPRSSLSKVLLWSTMRNSVATGRNQHIPKTLTLSRISKRARNQSNQLAVRMILPAQFDHPEKRYSYNEVQFKKVSLPVKTSCLPAKNINEISSMQIINKILPNLNAYTCFSLF